MHLENAMTEPTTAEIVHAIEYTITQQSPRTIAVRIADLEGKLKVAEQERDELDERRDELLVRLAYMDSFGYADAPCPKHSKPSLLKESCAKCKSEKAEATIKKISELPEKWRDNHLASGIPVSVWSECANELQAALNPSPPRS